MNPALAWIVALNRLFDRACDDAALAPATSSSSFCSIVLEFLSASRTAVSGSASTVGIESGVTIASDCPLGIRDLPAQRRLGAVAREPGVVHRGARAQQRELALEQIVLADLADFEPTLVQRVQRVVHGDVRQRVGERHLLRVQIEECVGRVAGHVFARLEISALGDRRGERLRPLVPDDRCAA